MYLVGSFSNGAASEDQATFDQLGNTSLVTLNVTAPQYLSQECEDDADRDLE